MITAPPNTYIFLYNYSRSNIVFKNQIISTVLFTVSLVSVLFLATIPVATPSLKTGMLTHPPAQLCLMLTELLNHDTAMQTLEFGRGK